MSFWNKTSIERYARKLFGIKVRVIVKKDINGYAAMAARCDRTIYVSKKAIANMSRNDYRDVIWHEVGHLMQRDQPNKIHKEVEAQMWALSEARRRGYNSVYISLFHFFDGWQYLTKKGYKRYRVAREKIIKEMKRCRMPLIRKKK